MESLSDEIEGNKFKKGCFTPELYPFKITPNFSTLGGFIEIKPNFIGSGISFLHDDSRREFLRFDSVVIYDQYNLSHNPVEILSFDNMFMETNIAQGMTFQIDLQPILINLRWTLIPVIDTFENSEVVFKGI